MKHTPGPWKLIVDDKAYFGDELKIVTDNRHIAAINPATNEGPGNAQLIAAAPEMYEALNSVCKGLCDHDYHTAVGLCKDCIVQDAIKKAEGVQ